MQREFKIFKTDIKHAVNGDFEVLHIHLYLNNSWNILTHRL